MAKSHPSSASIPGLPPQPPITVHGCENSGACQERFNNTLSAWGNYVEQRMAAFEEQVTRQIGGVEEKLRSEIQNQASQTQLAMQKMESAIVQSMNDNREEIKDALHKGDLEFKTLYGDLKAQQKEVTDLADKLKLMETSGFRRAMTAPVTPIAQPAQAPVVAETPGFWEKYVAPNLAAVLVALAISSIIGAGSFIMKSQWESDSAAAAKKAEEKRAAEAERLKSMVEAIRTSLQQAPPPPKGP